MSRPISSGGIIRLVVHAGKVYIPYGCVAAIDKFKTSQGVDLPGHFQEGIPVEWLDANDWAEIGRANGRFGA